ncbi:MAG: endonuclease [Bacteroidales bacterium]|nr:endonuclease [Bacteroidales bacterium]
MRKVGLMRLFFVVFAGMAASVLQAQIPAGYYDGASGKTGAALKTALAHIIKGHTKYTYDFLWTSFQYTDAKANGTVWDIYSDNPGGTPPYVFYFITSQCSTTPGYEGGCYNREHSFPKSWFGAVESDTMYSDMFHLYPTDSYVNSRRNNYPYGEVNIEDTTWTSENGSRLGTCSVAGYEGTVFEPIDEYKGDLARTYFYMATRYESRIASWQSYTGADAVLDGTSYPCYDSWFINMLLAWHEADPVSQKELDRNDSIYYKYQGNRNPFIDHPEYAQSIWGSLKPEPTNNATGFSTHNIVLQWEDATGDVVPDGYLIRMSSISFDAITSPTDGTPVSNDSSNKNILFGVKKCTFADLTPGTTYYFKIFSYKGSGTSIDYKTDNAPQVSQQAN